MERKSHKLSLSGIVPLQVKLVPADHDLTKIHYVGRLPIPLLLAIICLLGGVFYSSWGYLLAVLMLLCVLWQLWLIPRQVDYYRWAINEDAIYVCYGRFFQNVEMMPLARVQYADHTSGPVRRYWNQSKIVIHGAASGDGASIMIEGIKTDEARQICARIMNLAADKMAGI